MFKKPQITIIIFTPLKMSLTLFWETASRFNVFCLPDVPFGMGYGGQHDLVAG